MKIIYTFINCFFIFSLFTAKVDAQSAISLSTGISTDINNNNSFYQIPFSLIWKPFKDKNTPIFLEFDYDLPLGSKSAGDAYTLNPTLPQKVTLQEKIRPYVFTASFGFSIYLFTTKKNNAFYLNVVPLAICRQNIKVSYKGYDTKNYEILNPDVNSHKTGLVVSMAPVYYFHKAKRDMMLMLHLQTALLKWKKGYELSYKYLAPMQLTFGYNFYYNKK